MGGDGIVCARSGCVKNQKAVGGDVAINTQDVLWLLATNENYPSRRW